MKKELWEILVPTVRNDGRPFRLRYHRVWDAKVRAISGGLTIMPVAKGQWVHGGQLFSERMIPVRILATREEIEAIVDMSIKYYEQIAVMAYRVSDEVVLKYAKGAEPAPQKGCENCDELARPDSAYCETCVANGVEDDLR